MIDTKAIRCAVLQSAFSGKLTEYQEGDDSVDALLHRIDSSRDIKQKEDCPYDIPSHWAWVKLGDLYTINPKVQADDEEIAAFVPMEKISAGFDRSFSYEKQTWAKASKNHTRFADGDVAFAKITPCFENRKSFIAYDLPNGIGGGTTELIILRQKEILPKYTYYTIVDERFIGTGIGTYQGMVGQQRVKLDVLKNYLIPVPPLKEQQRVIDKIEIAFSWLDTVDKIQNKYHDNLSALKSKLIDAAIQGKLTEQLPEDGTAEELYQQIQQEKRKLVAEGKIKKEKALPPVSEDEIPFDIPENWKWVRFSDAYVLTNGLASRGTVNGNPHPVLRLADLVEGKIRKDGIRLLNLSDYEFQSHQVTHDDLIFIRVNGSKDKVAKAFHYESLTPISYCDHLFCGHRVSSCVYVKYWLYVYKSQWMNEQLSPEIKTTAGQNTISQSSMAKAIIPLPPLAEQKRIVARLEELLPLCE